MKIIYEWFALYACHEIDRQIEGDKISMVETLKILFEVIHRTPFWVWVVLLILFRRGMALTTDSPTSLGRSIIMPGIFIIWGLNTIIYQFKHPELLLDVYLIPGFLFSYLLYKNIKYHFKNGEMIQQGSFLPLSIMLTNFLVKYTLNVILATNSSLYNNIEFNLLYGCISGFTIGLFFGGIYKTIKAKKRLANS